MNNTNRQDGKASVRALVGTRPLALGLCYLAVVTGAAYAQITLPGPGIINTVAGNGTPGYSGDTQLAIHAELQAPEGLAVDSAGNIYIADHGNSVIRMVSATSGNISTVAGNHSLGAGYNGDGIAATSAQLNNPSGVAVDSSGNIYIADYGNNRIRKVSGGTITTIAGTGAACSNPPTGCGDGEPATGATLTNPAGVALDRAGDVFIADYGDNLVREVTASTLNISTVAGGGKGCTGETDGWGNGCLSTQGILSKPYGIALDSMNNIYIADVGSDFMVRKVTVVMGGLGGISALAGTGTGGYSADGCEASQCRLGTPSGVAVDGGDNVYITDTAYSLVRTVSASTGYLLTVAGDHTLGPGYSGDTGAATNAQINGSIGVAVDNYGNIYIGDTGNNVVRAVGSAVHVVIPAHGIIDTVVGNGFRGYSGDSGLATGAEINIPWGVTADYAGNIYVVDSNNFRIRKTTASTGIISTVAGDGSWSYSGDNGPATSAGMGPIGLALDATGNIYIAANERIRVVNTTSRQIVVAGVPIPAGFIQTVAGNGTQGFSGDNGLATSAELNNPSGVAVDSAGNIYIGDSGNNRIRKVSASTGKISTVAGNGTGGYNGDNIAATSAELSGPYDVKVDSGGNVYIADSFNSRIRKVTASTNKISTVAGTGVGGNLGDGGPATSAAVGVPFGVAVDTAGNVYISDQGSERIRAVGH